MGIKPGERETGGRLCFRRSSERARGYSEDGVHGDEEWSRARGKDDILSFEHYQRKHKLRHQGTATALHIVQLEMAKAAATGHGQNGAQSRTHGGGRQQSEQTPTSDQRIT